MYPVKFTERMKQMLGDEYSTFEASMESESYQALRINRLKADPDEFQKESPFPLEPVPWCAEGFYYPSAVRPGRHPFHEAGVYYIQEPSAMAPVEYLMVQPGQRILDLCASPGGKSTQIAAKMNDCGILFANEIHPVRAKNLSENIERMGIRNAVVTNETPERLALHFTEYFDRILVDAPCSGEGMFRKNEIAKEEWSEENVHLCVMRQDGILDEAAKMLIPGGRMVYSTCTFAPEENEGSISRFLKRHPEFHLVPAEPKGQMAQGNPQWYADAPEDVTKTIRLFPHLLHGEGHYLAILEKDGQGSGRVYAKNGEIRGIKRSDLKDWDAFAKENLNVEPDGIFLSFGDQLYLVPDGTPELKGLKVLRPGLHLGTRKKNRFEPAHALALALRQDEVKHSLSLEPDGDEIFAYLAGNTFAADGEKGWYLILADTYSTGWGKLAGGIMKNHYPRGLRKNLR